MTQYLSPTWAEHPFDPAAEAYAAAGGTLRLGRVVTGGPDGDVRYTAVIGEGEVRYERGVVDDVDVTLTDTYANALAQARGELDPNAAFMRGQTKVSGPTSAVLAILAVTKSELYEVERRKLAGQLEG